MFFLSIIIPVYNEADNVRPLFEKIQTVCQTIGDGYEVLFIDDGSMDETFTVLSELSELEPQLAVIRFKENAGQTAAMAAGFEFAEGQRIISMDGDLQNDPSDIPALLAKLDEGYDLVCGWRKERQDKFVTRRIPSIVANWIIGKVTGVPIHDNGCSLKAYRASIIKQVPLYGEMHRFIPAMSTVAGARIAEIVVTHHPRHLGKSKYGLGRIWRVMLDIIAFQLIISVFRQGSNSLKRFLPKWGKLARFFMFQCKRRPLRVFGPFSTMGFTLGSILLIGLSKTNTMVGASILLIGGGILAFCFGLFGELVSFANAKHVKDYKVKTFLRRKK
ncbi:glycosyltransferase [Candidatus Poribacteria bacterium]|nr:MAG: glycosyltransferase [Candidatus Poribacteria bacterium]